MHIHLFSDIRCCLVLQHLLVTMPRKLHRAHTLLRALTYLWSVLHSLSEIGVALSALGPSAIALAYLFLCVSLLFLALSLSHTTCVFELVGSIFWYLYVRGALALSRRKSIGKSP